MDKAAIVQYTLNNSSRLNSHPNPEVAMPHLLDVMLVIAFAAVWPLAEYFWYWPRHVRALAGGDPHARSRWYSRVAVEEWVFAGAVMALAFWFARSPAALGLSLPRGW